MKKIRIYKRGEVWWLDYFARGKRVRQSTKCGDRKAARRFADAIETAARVPTFEQAVEVLRMVYGETPANVTPLSDAWTAYERLAKATGKTTENMARRKSVLERLLRWIAKERPRVETIEAVDGPCAAAFAAHLAGQGIKTKTRANIIGELGTIWRLLEKGSAGVHNPWGGLMPRITDAQRGEAFTPEQEAAVLAAAEKVGKDWLPVCQIMRLTGLRYGDVANLDWADVDFGRRVIDTVPSKTRKHRVSVLVPMADALFDALSAVPSEDRTGLVLPEHAVNYPRGLKNEVSFSRVLEAAGLDVRRYTFHSWRHTFRTRLADAGVSDEAARRLGGWTNLGMAAHYDHSKHLPELRAAISAMQGRSVGSSGGSATGLA